MDHLQGMSTEALQDRQHHLTEQRNAIIDEMLAIAAELESRHAMEKAQAEVEAMSPAQRQAMAQVLQAGHIAGGSVVNGIS